MCLAVPGKVISINNEAPVKTADVDFAGVKKEICIEWLPEVKTGDYILVHAGLALNIIDEETAQETLASLRIIGENMDEEE